MLGTWHLVFDKEAGKPFTGLTVATVFLVNLVTYHCTAVLLVELQGTIVCLDLKPTENVAKHSYHCAENEEWCKGGDELSGAGDLCLEPTPAKLEESVNKAAFKPAIVLMLGNTTYLLSVTGMI
jgi:hypothetical protein